MNIILQHWTGEIDEVVEASSECVERYAESIGAEYRLLRGDVFRAGLSPPCQKMAMISEEWDEFDGLVMLDADMFPVTTEDIFKVDGIGVHTPYTTSIFVRMAIQMPKMTDWRYPYWGGAVWKLTREQREMFRKRIRPDELEEFSGNFEDEGMMHRLASLARFASPARIPEEWAWCSYRPGIERAKIIHLRRQYEPHGPRVAKVENLERLRSCGHI